MHVSFKVSRNDIGPALTRMARIAKNPRPILLAMGNVFKSITEGNFSNAGNEYRPSPWAPKRDGSPSTLKKSGLLWHSFHLTVDDHYAKLSNPTPYAAIHQFGGTILPVNAKALVFTLPDGTTIHAKKVVMPPRPFYPVINGKLTPAAEDKIARAGERAARREFNAG